jgi:hypothetical protein
MHDYACVQGKWQLCACTCVPHGDPDKPVRCIHTLASEPCPLMSSRPLLESITHSDLQGPPPNFCPVLPGDSIATTVGLVGPHERNCSASSSTGLQLWCIANSTLSCKARFKIRARETNFAGCTASVRMGPESNDAVIILIWCNVAASAPKRRHCCSHVVRNICGGTLIASLSLLLILPGQHATPVHSSAGPRASDQHRNLLFCT